jgi:ectoine hydroxylase-related dioxygenase (phytanoyl-CoA dioxygenase family)
MKMHSDQYWTPTIQEEPLAYSRLGENGLDRAEVGHSAVRRDYLFPPCMVTLVWAITDFTADNGATVFVPGSHMSGLQPDYRHDFSDAVPAEMPAGSIVLWDGRTWHATGANRTQNQYRVGVTNNMVAPMIRPLVNYPYSLRAEVVERLDERQKQLLGFTTWTAYGNEGVPMQDLEYFKPAADQPGAMR